LTPEEKAREKIDILLQKADWDVQDLKRVNIHANKGVAIREYPLPGYGEADYLLYVDAKAVGVIEAKKEGSTLTGAEIQRGRGNPPLQKRI
jgi:type I restriction enzyme R subunit